MGNPWKGLASYEESDNAKFHGRKRSVRELVALIKSKLFVTLYGRTGIGKTSLLQAGVFKVLRAVGYVPVAVRFDGASTRPFADHVIAAIEGAGFEIDTLAGASDQVPEADRLWHYFATRHFFIAGADGARRRAFPLVVLDQFEENLRHPDRKERAWMLMRQLYALTDDNKAFPEGYHSQTNFRIVVSIREDDLFRLEDCIDTLSLTGLKYNRYRLLQLSDDEATEIITIPGGDMLPADGVQRQAFIARVIGLARTDAGDISTLMLSLLLTELWDRAQGAPFEAAMLSDAGAHDLIESFYLKAVAALSPEERSSLEDLMVDEDGRRNSVNESRVAAAYAGWRTLTDGSSRILQVTNGRVEIVHDILAKTIFDIRRTRREQQRIAELERQRALDRRKARRRMAVLGACLAAVLLTGAIFFWQYLRIQENQRGLLMNQSRAITTMANNLIDNDSDYYRAAQLALEALPRDLSHPDRPYIPEAEFALRRALSHPLPRLLQWHTDWVYSVALSPDGTKIVSGSRDTTFHIWDVGTGQQIGEPLRGHTGWVNSVAFSPDGNRMASASRDSTIRIWDVGTGQQIGEPLRGHTDWIRSVAFSPDGSKIASGSDDKTIRIWDAQSGDSIGEPLRGHTGWIFSVAFSPDGRKIVSGSHDNTIRIWDAQSGDSIGEPLGGHTDWVLAVAFSPDGTKIISGSYDNTIRIWDAQSGDSIGEPLRGHTNWVRSVAFSPDGTIIVSGASDNTIRIWDARTGQQIGEPMRGHTKPVNSVAFSKDGDKIISGSFDGHIGIWEVADCTPTEVCHVDGFTRAFSPDGSKVVFESGSTIQIRDVHTGEPIGQPLPLWQSLRNGIRSLAFSPDNNKIVTGSDIGTIQIWDALTGEPIGEPLIGHTDGVNTVSFSPDGNYIVSGADDETIRLWDVETRQQIGNSLRGHSGYVYSVVFSADGSTIASGSWDETIRLWNVNTGQQIGEPLRGNTQWINSIDFGPDSKRVASGSTDKTIRIWDVRTGQQIGDPLRGHTNYVLYVAFSPDGKKIISYSYDNTIRIWDVETGVQIHQLDGRLGRFTEDGSKIVYVDLDNNVREYKWPLQELMDEARAKLTRPLTPEERRRFYIE